MKKSKLKERFQEKDGIEMRLFVDLMIANQGDKKIVNEKLDELWKFIQQALKEEGNKRYEEGARKQALMDADLINSLKNK